MDGEEGKEVLLFLLWFDRLPVFFFQYSSEIAEFSCALQEFAAVHADDFTIDIAGAVAHQKGGEIGEFFDGAEAVLRVAVEGNLLEAGMGKDAGECALGGDRTGSDGVHADSAVAPFHCQAASESFDTSFRDGRRDDVGRAYWRVGGGDAEDRAGMRGFEPAASAGHRAVEGSHQDDADDGVPCAGRKFFGAGDEIPGGVVDENVEGALSPNGIHHGFDGVEAANVAGDCVDCALW